MQCSVKLSRVDLATDNVIKNYQTTSNMGLLWATLMELKWAMNFPSVELAIVGLHNHLQAGIDNTRCALWEVESGSYRHMGYWAGLGTPMC
jgi:hypothetical protein